MEDTPDTMTKAEARRLLGVTSDYALAKRLNINRASVSRWGRMVPKTQRSIVLLLHQGDALVKRGAK